MKSSGNYTILFFCMSRRKLKKIHEAETFPNVFGEDVSKQVGWPQSYFGNSLPVYLELGCGTGAYTLGLAGLLPVNVIGVDVKGARIWQGAKSALEQKIDRVAFLRAGAEKLEEYFQPNSIEAIWITFPDPFPKKKQAKHRLTSPRFLEVYKKLLAKPFGSAQGKNGTVNLKTDDEALFDYSVEIAEACGWKIEKAMKNIYAKEVTDPALLIQTTYEKRHLAEGRKIYYLRLCL